MTTVADLLNHLDAWAPFARAATWDPVGLQIGDPDAGVTTAAVCHEVTADVVRAAVESDVDVVVTYHPLLFRPISRITTGTGPAGMGFMFARAGVSVIAAHTNLDAAPGGTSDALAAALGLDILQPFGAVEGSEQVKVVVYVPSEVAHEIRTAMAQAGAGTIGLYRACSFEAPGLGRFTAGHGSDPTVGSVGRDNLVDELRLEMTAPAAAHRDIVAAARAAHPYEEPAIDVYSLLVEGPAIGRLGSLPDPVGLEQFVRTVSDALGESPIRYSHAGSDVVQSVAVVPGAGAGFASEARALGADVLVTGDARHHATVAAAREGLAIVDATHEGTERPGLKALYRSVAEIVNTLDLTALSAGPWKSL